MAGINVNQITSMLAKLRPDSALQQYAQMHKNDPYIVSLAAHESNRRKELRNADQAAQGMQQQPKVVDAAIAQMAPQPMPEDVGIGQLRAPNMQFGAEGGIMGYDEGYDEGGMTYGQDPVMMMADGGVARYQSGGMSFIDRLTYGNISPAEKARKEALERQAEMGRVLPYPESIEDIRTRNMQRVINADYTRTDPRALASMPSGKEQMAALNAPSSAPVSASDAANKKPSAAPRPGAGAGPAAAVPEQSEIERFLAMQKAMGMGPEANADLAWQRSQLADRMRAQSKSELEDFEKDVAARGKYGEAKEERLAKREADLG